MTTRRRPVLVRRRHVHERVRIAVDELRQLAFELDLFLDVVGGAVGVMGRRDAAGHQDPAEQKNHISHCTLSKVRLKADTTRYLRRLR